MEFCLLAAGATVRLGTMALTLAWTHSIEKIRWEEDYVVREGALDLVEARIRGTGAGMEPPEGATLDARGVWHYRPQVRSVPSLSLARSTYTRDYELCVEQRCRSLDEYVPVSEGTTTVTPCSRRSPGGIADHDSASRRVDPARGARE